MSFGMLLRPFDPKKCCLCGVQKNLTGEHKIKKSALQAEFGNTPMYIGNWDNNYSLPKLAQSTKSKHFHFKGKICKECNGSRTQKSDQSFEQYHKELVKNLRSGHPEHWKDGIFSPPNFQDGSGNSISLFRYFSKILCCRLAESEGPIPISLAKHAIGEFEQNRVWLQVRRDPTQEQFENEFGPSPYAAHGGLVIYSDKINGEPKAFHSSISIGPAQYIFWFRLHWLEKLELRFFHKEFYRYCKYTALDKNNIIQDEQLKQKLGF